MLIDLQKKEKRCVHKEIYYHNALTVCDGQRRKECVNIAKQRRVGAQCQSPANKRQDQHTRKFYHDALTHCDDKGETSVCTMQSRGTSVSLQIEEKRCVHKEILS